MIKQFSSKARNFNQQLSALLTIENIIDKNIINQVEAIIETVKQKGDKALLDYSEKFDQFSVKNINELKLNKQHFKAAFSALKPTDKSTLQTAATRIEQYHQKQKLTSWHYKDDLNNQLGQKITPIERVGLYVPGGQASYPSSVLMNAIPAKVAGVKEVMMLVPAPKGVLNPLVLAAAHLADVSSALLLGGAQAIAAAAYGTESITKVDKIVGPGNIYVTAAKRLVFGIVGIDMVAGPSEILIICDGKTNPDWVAMDLFSQAEHDQDAQSILLCPDKNYIKQVLASMQTLLPSMKRRAIIKKSLQNRGALIHTQSLEEAFTISNKIAPEHLELSIENPEHYLDKIKHAGAIFMGSWTSEALGDYCAGPNHVLPTSGSARFFSPLGVYDFQKRSSVIYASKTGANTLGKIAAALAKNEGLSAHQKSAQYRLNK